MYLNTVSEAVFIINPITIKAVEVNRIESITHGTDPTAVRVYDNFTLF